MLHIGTKAYAALRDSGKLDRFPQTNVSAFEKRGQVSDLTLRHELEVMDVRVAFFREVRLHPNLKISEFNTWPALFQFTARHDSPDLGRRELIVKPDGFIRIHEKTGEGTFEHLFFLELDRSTETQNVLAQKAACYLDHYRTGGMAIWLGGRREDFKSYPFRVLMVFKSTERRNNTLQRLIRNSPPILTQVWATVLSQATRSPLGNIWARPKDFMEPAHRMLSHLFSNTLHT